MQEGNTRYTAAHWAVFTRLVFRGVLPKLKPLVYAIEHGVAVTKGRDTQKATELAIEKLKEAR